MCRRLLGKSIEHTPVMDDAVEADGRNINSGFIKPPALCLTLIAENVVFGDFDQRRR